MFGVGEKAHTFGVKNVVSGNSLAVRWLGLHTFTAEDTGLIPGQGTKIPQAAQHVQK